MKKVLLFVVLSIGFSFAADTLDDANKAYNENNFAKAIEVYKKLCDAKEPKACSALGYMYQNGKGVSENSTLAKEFYKKACDAGDTESCSKSSW